MCKNLNLGKLEALSTVILFTLQNRYSALQSMYFSVPFNGEIPVVRWERDLNYYRVIYTQVLGVKQGSPGESGGLQ